jgi:hypothetical protein
MTYYTKYINTNNSPIGIDMTVGWDIIDGQYVDNEKQFQVAERVPERDRLELVYDETNKLISKPYANTLEITGSVESAAICLIHYIQMTSDTSTGAPEVPNWFPTIIFSSDKSRILSCDKHLIEFSRHYNRLYDYFMILR